MGSILFSGCHSPHLRPVMVFDGECGFCRFWIARWRISTGGKVDYLPFQEVAGDYPAIPRKAFQRAVYLIEPDGRVTSGADAVLRCLQFSAGPVRWLGKAPFLIPGGLPVARAAYGFVARHRTALGWVTRLLWRKSDSDGSSAGGARQPFRWFLGLAFLFALAALLLRTLWPLAKEVRVRRSWQK